MRIPVKTAFETAESHTKADSVGGGNRKHVRRRVCESGRCDRAGGTIPRRSGYIRAHSEEFDRRAAISTGVERNHGSLVATNGSHVDWRGRHVDWQKSTRSETAFQHTYTYKFETKLDQSMGMIPGRCWLECCIGKGHRYQDREH
jgi:hypothetical protein